MHGAHICLKTSGEAEERHEHQRHRSLWSNMEKKHDKYHISRSLYNWFMRGFVRPIAAAVVIAIVAMTTHSVIREWWWWWWWDGVIHFLDPVEINYSEVTGVCDGRGGLRYWTLLGESELYGIYWELGYSISTKNKLNQVCMLDILSNGQ